MLRVIQEIPFQIPVPEDDVNSSIDKIKIASSKGIDETLPKFVKLSQCVLSFVLTKPFNKCVQQETS